MTYNVLRRPTSKILTEGTSTKTLEVYVYGETQTNAKLNNLRTQLYQHFDGSGKQQINQYDFKGNPLETQQQLFDDPTITDADWGSTPPVLSTEIFTAGGTFDALNRPVTSTDPGGNIQAFTYDKSGLLKTVMLNSDPYVQDIHYDAKGQRQAIWYGNNTKTSYTYEPETFRLQRLLTVGLTANDILQDLNYWYDPVGNISEIQDDAQQTLFFNNSVVSPTQQFTYDALYRLIEAQGRELIGTAAFGPQDNWNDAPWMGQTQPGNGAALQNYTQQYTYDEVGNILQLQHIAGTGSYTRTYNIDTTSNRLSSTTVGANTYNYSYDNRGNMLTMPHLNSMVWNASNELAGITKGSEPTHYQYSNGQRTRKYTDKGSIKDERIYLGNYELYRKYDSTGTVIEIERTTVHVSDDTGRVAMLETRTQGTDPGPASLQRYVYSNHLQSASLELDENAAIISYEEYHPYGTTAYQAMNASINAVAKRYRFGSKERDDESGLYYHGARYYIPWLARWTACDPMESDYAGMSPYNYGFNNPIKWQDSTGMQPDLPTTSTNKYGEKQVYQYTTGYTDAFISTRETHTVIPENATAVSEGLNDVQLYRLAVGRAFNPGQFTIDANQYLDEKYFETEQNVKKYFSMLATPTMANTKESRQLTADIHNKVVEGLFSDSKFLAEASIETIERRNSFLGSFNWGKAGIELAVAGGLVNRFNKLWISALGNRGANLVVPKGFTSMARFKEAGEELAGALQQSGIKYSEIGVRGSAVTNVSGKGGGFREVAGKLRASDIDVYIHLSEDIGLKSSKNIEGFIHPDKLLKQYPLLQNWSDKWSRILGREITPGGFKPGTFTDKNIIKMKF